MKRTPSRRTGVNQAQVQLRKELMGFVQRFHTDKPPMTSDELEKFHTMLTHIARKRKADNELLAQVERAELDLFKARFRDDRMFTLAQLRRFRQVASWQLKGDDREQTLFSIDLRIAAKKPL